MSEYVEGDFAPPARLGTTIMILNTNAVIGSYMKFNFTLRFKFRSKLSKFAKLPTYKILPAHDVHQPLTFTCRWADYLARVDKFEHAPWADRNGQGENLARFSRSSNTVGQVATTMWYNEVANYDYNNPVFAMNTGISFNLPYYPGYKAIALFPIQGHPWRYNEYKAMTL